MDAYQYLHSRFTEAMSKHYWASDDANVSETLEAIMEEVGLRFDEKPKYVPTIQEQEMARKVQEIKEKFGIHGTPATA